MGQLLLANGPHTCPEQVSAPKIPRTPHSSSLATAPPRGAPGSGPVGHRAVLPDQSVPQLPILKEPEGHFCESSVRSNITPKHFDEMLFSTAFFLAKINKLPTLDSVPENVKVIQLDPTRRIDSVQILLFFFFLFPGEWVVDETTGVKSSNGLGFDNPTHQSIPFMTQQHTNSGPTPWSRCRSSEKPPSCSYPVSWRCASPLATTIFSVLYYIDLLPAEKVRAIGPSRPGLYPVPLPGRWPGP